MTGTSLARLTWLEAGAEPLLLVPVGSTEQHGPALPLGTDALVAGEVARLAAERLAPTLPALVAPTLPYGASGEHEDFPGTLSLGHEALQLTLVELVRSGSRWAGGVVLVNGHGGNVASLVTVVTRLRSEGHRVAWSNCSPDPPGDAHAGRTETSLLLALAPDRVRTELLAAGAREPLGDLMPRLRAEGVRAVSPNGVLGDPDGASAEEGRLLLEGMATRLAADLRSSVELSVDDHGRLVG